MASVIRGTN
jgi:hypothetical protein